MCCRKETESKPKYQGMPFQIIKTKTSERADMQMKERGMRYTQRGGGRAGEERDRALIAVNCCSHPGSNHSEAVCVLCVCMSVRTILILPQPLGIALSSVERRLACALALVYN